MRAWIVALGIAAGCGGSTVRPEPARDVIANLHAFARVYGVVRWFHPSDAAASVDWDRFAIDGVQRVMAVDARHLRGELEALFAPIAPTMHFATTGEAFPDEPALHAPDGAEIVAWEHLGYGDSMLVSAYASKRRHRARLVADTDEMSLGALGQAIDATPYRGRRVRLRGKVRAQGHAQGQLWLRVERGSAEGFNDGRFDGGITTRGWTAVELVGIVDADATKIVVGAMANGTGSAWFDDLELAAQTKDGWQPVALANADFEAAALMTGWQPGLVYREVTTTNGWSLTRDPEGPASGTASLKIQAATHPSADELFAEAPTAGETVDVDLGNGLRARVPIALYSRGGHTIGDAGVVAQPPTTSSTVAGNVADVVVAWNVLQHFWPYWAEAPGNWLPELDRALRDALDDRGVEDHVLTLRRLALAAPDGHASVSCPGRAPRARPPFAVDVIEGAVVVVASATPEVARGDVIVAVDGRPALAQLQADEAVVSGSPQWRRELARTRFAAGADGTSVRVALRHLGREVALVLRRASPMLDETMHPPIERLSDGIYYVDMSRVSDEEFGHIVDKIAAAPGVVFDVRDYPSTGVSVLSHLIAQKDTARWMSIAHIVRPDHAATAIPSWTTEGWAMAPAAPRITGRVAFLTGPGAISYGESVMGLVAHYRLGDIVGSATAGTNGNIAQISLPSGCSSVFTGMKVTRGDGGRFHLLGVQPTIPATRTIAGIAAGRDEILERALAHLRR